MSCYSALTIMHTAYRYTVQHTDGVVVKGSGTELKSFIAPITPTTVKDVWTEIHFRTNLAGNEMHKSSKLSTALPNSIGVRDVLFDATNDIISEYVHLPHFSVLSITNMW